MNENKVSEAISLVFKIYRQHKKTIIKIILLLMLILCSNMLLPQISADIIDKGFSVGDHYFVISRALFLGALHLFMAIVYVLIEHYRLKGYNEVQTELKSKSIDKLLNLKIKYFNNRSATEIFQQLDEDIRAISGCFSSEILMALIQIFITLGLIPILVKISWKLTLFMMLAIPLKIIKTIIFTKRGYKIAKKLVDRENKYSSLLSDIILGMQTIRCFGLNKHFYSAFQKRQNDVVDSQYKNDMFQEVNVQTESMVADLLACICYCVASFLIAGNDITLGEFIAFQTYSLTILDFVGMFLNVGYSFSILMPSFERYTEFINEASEKTDGIPCDINEPKIELKNISFSYIDDMPVFRNLNLEIPHGSHIAILGNNGSGKTTLINLLLRLYEPQQGTISLNEQNIDLYEIESYRQIFSVASQKPFLFCDSIRNNICLFKEVDKERLEWAIECSGLSSLVEEKTLEYCVGQDGCELSGGQRQRISLARTLVTDCPIVILDETEANIDADYEAILERLMKVCYKNRTVIAITHRNDLLKYMDKCYKLDDIAGSLEE